MTGPLYFIPTNCLKVNNFQVPKVDMPIIAVVGENNPAQYMIASYIDELTKLQVKEHGKADSYLKIVTGDSDAVLPTWKMKTFEDKD